MTCESVQGMDGSGWHPGLNTGSTPSRRPGVPAIFYGGNARVVSPLIYFICHHVNKVLELPVRLRHVLENSGWQREWDYLEEHDVGTLVDGLE